MNSYSNDYMRACNAYNKRLRLLLIDIFVTIMNNNTHLINHPDAIEYNNNQDALFIEEYFRYKIAESNISNILNFIKSVAPVIGSDNTQLFDFCQFLDELHQDYQSKILLKQYTANNYETPNKCEYIVAFNKYLSIATKKFAELPVHFQKLYKTKEYYAGLMLIYDRTATYDKIKQKETSNKNIKKLSPQNILEKMLKSLDIKNDLKEKLVVSSTDYAKSSLISDHFLSIHLSKFIIDILLMYLPGCDSVIPNISKYVYYQIRKSHDYPITFVFNKLFSQLKNNFPEITLNIQYIEFYACLEKQKRYAGEGKDDLYASQREAYNKAIPTMEIQPAGIQLYQSKEEYISLKLIDDIWITETFCMNPSFVKKSINNVKDYIGKLSSDKSGLLNSAKQYMAGLGTGVIGSYLLGGDNQTYPSVIYNGNLQMNAQPSLIGGLANSCLFPLINLLSCFLGQR